MMIYTVELTLAAQADIQAIANYYLEAAGQHVALNVVTNIEAAIVRLTEQPHRGHKPHELYSVPNARELEIIVDHYRIIYLTHGDTIYVIAIFDGRQNVKKHLDNRRTQAFI